MLTFYILYQSLCNVFKVSSGGYGYFALKPKSKDDEICKKCLKNYQTLIKETNTVFKTFEEQIDDFQIQITNKKIVGIGIGDKK